MTTEELKEKAIEYFAPDIEAKDIMNVNHKPHPYMIGAKHVIYASDHFNGRLGEAAIEAAEKSGIHCEMPNCRVPYSEHTKGDKAIFLFLNKDMTGKEIQEKLKVFVDLYPKEFDGFVFVKSEFNIINEKEEK